MVCAEGYFGKMLAPKNLQLLKSLCLDDFNSSYGLIEYAISNGCSPQETSRSLVFPKAYSLCFGKMGLSHFRSFMLELGNILHCCSDIETIDWEFTSRKDGRKKYCICIQSEKTIDDSMALSILDS